MAFTKRLKKIQLEVFAFKEEFVHKLEDLFGLWCLIVFEHPIKVNLAALLIFFLSLFGFIPTHARWVDGAENLYCLPVSEAMEDRMVHDSLFSQQASRAQFMIITSNPPGRNIFTWEDLEKAAMVDQIVRGQRADPVEGRLIGLPAIKKFMPDGGYDDEAYAKLPDETTKPMLNFQDMCSPDPVTGCRVQSVFEMGVFDVKKLLEPSSPPELYIIDGLVFAMNKKGFVPGLLLGGMVVEDCVRELPTALLSEILSEDRLFNGSTPGYSRAKMQCVKEAKALNFIYELVDNPKYTLRNLGWEALFYEVLRDNVHLGNLTIGANAFRARDDELSNSTAQSSDVIFVVFTFILLVVYAAVINFNFDLYRNKAMSSLVGSLGVFMGCVAGLGYPSLFGVAFVPTSLVTPFLVMGVGADDIFVIISSCSLAYGEGSARERVAVAMRGCGVSVLMTTVTNCLAFAIGVQSHYLAVKNFCIFTIVGLFLSLVFELTMFLSCVCYDARREDAMLAFYTGLPRKVPKPCHKVEETVSVFQLATVLVRREYEHLWLGHPQPYKREEKRAWWKRALDLPHIIDIFTNAGNMWWAPIGSIAPPSGAAAGEGALSSTDVSRMESKEDTSEKAFQSPEITSEDSPSPRVSRRSPSYRLNLPNRHGDCEINNPKTARLARFVLDDKLRHEAYAREPRGNVGRRWRIGFIRVYCRVLLHPVTKVAVLITFSLTFSFAIYGMMHITKGLELVDLAPDGAYLKVYDSLQANFMNEYDLPVDVFYPEYTEWWDPRVQRTLLLYDQKLSSYKATKYLSDPLMRMIQDPSLAPLLTSGDKMTFLQALRDTLSDPASKYHQFDSEFTWDGKELLTWRSLLLPAYMKSSEDRANWMRMVRRIGQEVSEIPLTNTTAPLIVTAWNFMLIFYESDLAIVPSVIAALTTAGLAMVVIAFIMIPEIFSGLLVITVMGVIDFTVMGFMYYWDVALNMISMIILVISIGFSVDYTSHMCYIFTNCLGNTRNVRITEAIVLVGTPLFHGAMANLFGVVLLGWSTSYIFRVFFKMMTLVVLFGISHGMILLPVLLSLFGTMAGCQKVYEEDVPRLQDFFAEAPKLPAEHSMVSESMRSLSKMVSVMSQWGQDKPPNKQASGKGDSFSRRN